MIEHLNISWIFYTRDLCFDEKMVFHFVSFYCKVPAFTDIALVYFLRLAPS